MRNDDYLELEALSDYDEDEDEPIALWAYDNDGNTIVLRNVSSAVRYRGWWSISHCIAEHIPAIAYIPAESIKYFDLLPRKRHDAADRKDEDIDDD